MGYRVYRSTDASFVPTSSLLIAEVETPRYIDSAVAVGTAYYYQITAYDRGNKESAGSVGAATYFPTLPKTG